MRYRGLILLGIVALLYGCDLFDTRNPEPPNAGRGSWEIPRVPDDVLTNLSNALLERNVINYLLTFEQENFEFIADPEALQQNPSLEGWSYQSESNHINSLFNVGTLPNDSLLAVVFLQSEQTTFGDSAEIIADYELQAQIALEGAPGSMAGTAHFYLRIGEVGYWEIYLWQDQRTEENSTWSDLKSLVQ